MTDKNKQCRILLATIAGTMMIPGSTVLAADETAEVQSSSLMPIVGIETALSESLETDVLGRMNLYMVQTDTGEYLNRAFSNVSDYTYIRTAPDESSDWSGKLYNDSMVDVLEYQGDWTKISSGNVEGYVPSECLYLGDAAQQYEDENTSALVLADVLNVREGTDTDQKILTQILLNETYPVTGEAVDGWYPIQVGDISGWVSGDYVDVEATCRVAESREEEEARVAAETEAQETEIQETEVQETVSQEPAEETVEETYAQTTGNGQAVIDFACQFIGNPYVWGGTSLTDGADCSGFVQSVYAHFGVSLPRTTWDMETVGTEVSYDQAMPGDIVLYDGHVGLYMGDGTIVNAMNENDGIGICNADYAPIITIRRVI